MWTRVGKYFARHVLNGFVLGPCWLLLGCCGFPMAFLLVPYEFAPFPLLWEARSRKTLFQTPGIISNLRAHVLPHRNN